MRRAGIGVLAACCSACVFDTSGLAVPPSNDIARTTEAPRAEQPVRRDDACTCQDSTQDRAASDVAPDAWSVDGAIKHDAPRLESAVKKDAPKPDSAIKKDAPKPDSAIKKDAPKPDSVKKDLVPWPLFTDDFSAPSSLIGDTGVWGVSGGVMKQTSCTYTPDAVIPNQSWSDVTVQVRFRADAACSVYNQAGLMVRVQGAAGCAGNKYYWCLADFDEDEIRIGKLNGACTTSSNWTLKAIGPLDFSLWYWMKLTAKGNTMTCTVWGGNLPSAQTHSWTDSTGAPFATGSAGLVTAGVQASFDDLQVTAD